MQVFIEQLAKYILNNKYDLSNLYVILPSQRGELYLKDRLKYHLDKISFIPKIITFEALIEHLTNFKKTTKVELLILLYKAYLFLPLEDTDRESFDGFIKWGDIVLEDFNFIDLHLGHKQKIFVDLSDINKIHNWEPNTEVSKSYLNFLQKLTFLYDKFINLLSLEHKAYQGLLYREAVEQLPLYSSLTNKHFIFAGFSYFNNSQWSIVSELLEQSKATLLWNIDPKYHYLYDKNTLFKKIKTEQWSKGLTDFVTHEETKNDQKFSVVGVSSKTGLIKYLGTYLKGRKDYTDVAVLLTNPNLVTPLINTLPTSIEDINLTIGIPLKTLGFHAFFSSLISLYLQVDLDKTIHHKDLINLIEYPLLNKLDLDVDKIKQHILKGKKTLIDECALVEISNLLPNALATLLKQLFTVNTRMFLLVLNDFIILLKDVVDVFEREILYKHYTINTQLIQIIDNYKLDFSKQTILKLYTQLIQGEQITLLGEPLKGLQIMGLLEMQSLSFSKVIVIQANENFLPVESQQSSYIPYDIRKKHNLPTHEHKQFEQSFIFSQIIAKAKEVEIIYNTNTEVFGNSELSRLVQNVMRHEQNVDFKTVNIPSSFFEFKEKKIYKTKEIVNQLKTWFSQSVSPSALGTYVYNPLEFYKKYILNITPDEELKDLIGEDILGLIVHQTLENLYRPYVNKVLTIDIVKTIQKKLEDELDKSVLEYFKIDENIEGLNLLTIEIARHFVKRFVQEELTSVNQGHKIKILHLEKKMQASYQLDNLQQIIFKGTIDRVDQFNDIIRVIDYKTGKVEQAQLKYNKLEENIFDYKYSKSIQILIYAYLFLESNPNLENSIQVGIISFKNHKLGFIPLMLDKTILTLDKHTIKDKLIVINQLLLNILDLEQPFVEKV